MCGRYTLRRPGLVAKYVYQNSFEEFSNTRIIPRFNVAPSQQVMVIRNNKEQQQMPGLLRWGLIPSWQKAMPKAQPINAKAETVATSGMFKNAFQRRRCLQIADGFFEWKDLNDGNGKTPFFIRRPDNEILFLAGIWERWNDPANDHVVDSVAHITTTPNEVMEPIHNRMPVILNEGEAKEWLQPDAEPQRLHELLKPYAGELAVDQVSKIVGNPRNDVPECVIPLT